jgi:homoserine kinase
MKRNKIKVFAPATVANLGCGFDVMGLAIDQPGDELTVELNREKKLIIHKISGDGGKLSLDPSKNTATVSIRALLNSLEIDQGFTISLKKKMPLGSGLGSSAASSVAGAIAANELLGRPYSREELILFAMEGERIACGAAHADNVAPAMLGGIVLIRSYDPFDVIQLPVPKKLFITVVHPDLVVMTKDARAVIPKNIPLSVAIQQWSNTAALTAGLFSGDMELIGRAVEDYVAEPNRKVLIRAFDKVKNSAMNAGALACSISGSGPSMFALSDHADKAKRIAIEMKKSFRNESISSQSYVSKVNTKGVTKI